MSDPLSYSAPTSSVREPIPSAVRREVMDSEVCAYCCAVWASVPDHVIPVAQGGRSVVENLVPACNRCNSQKSGKTPAQWKARRLARGKCWPPPNLQFTLPELVMQLPEAQAWLIRNAVVAAYPPLMRAAAAMHDRYYDEEPRPVADDQAELLELAEAYCAEVAT